MKTGSMIFLSMPFWFAEMFQQLVSISMYIRIYPLLFILVWVHHKVYYTKVQTIPCDTPTWCMLGLQVFQVIVILQLLNLQWVSDSPASTVKLHLSSWNITELVWQMLTLKLYHSFQSKMMPLIHRHTIVSHQNTST